MRSYLILLPLAMALAGCDKHHSMLGAIQSPKTIDGGLYVVMGQSNADRMYKYAGQALYAGLQAKAISEIYGLNCAIGGAAISSWMPGEVNYQACLDAIKASGKPVAGILWWQGEAEAEGADEHAAKYWDVSFTTLINQFRSDIHALGAPAVYARLSDLNHGLPYLNNVIGAQESVHIAGGILISVDDVPVADGLHYTTENYQILAKEFIGAI